MGKFKPKPRSQEEIERLTNQTAMRIVDAFRSGDIPKALAPSFIQRKDNIPCRSWSWRNQLLTALAGHSDARTFNGWKAVKRFVKKGEKAFCILEPRKIPKRDKDGEFVMRLNEKTGKMEKVFITMFKPAKRFGYSQTDGQPLKVDKEYANWLNNLPLREVAESWGITVEGYNGESGRALGRFQYSALTGEGRAIALGVKNLATWAHELLHAADNKLGNLKENGQHWRSETVAELGGTILLECLGLSEESDKGGCWEYVNRYASAAEINTVKACMDVLDRACKAVSLILDEAEKITVERAA